MTDASQLAEAAFRRGDWAEVARYLEPIRATDGASPTTLYRLAFAYAQLGRRKDAFAVYRSMLALAPSDKQGLTACAVLAIEEEAFTAAVAAASRAVALEPLDLASLNMLGAALIDAGWPQRALRVLKRAITIDPHSEGVLRNYAVALTRSGRYAEAATTQERNLLRLAGSRLDVETPVLCNSLKIRHDIEQYRYLLKRRKAPPEAAAVVARYEMLLKEVADAGIGDRNFNVAPSTLGPAGRSFGRMVRRRPPSRLPGSAVSPSWDRQRVSEQFSGPPGLCWIDGFLTSKALATLRAFCLESTIWHDISHNLHDAEAPRGYLGAYPETGFCAPLLYQIAEELAESLPAVFGGRFLRQMWSYKYEADLAGIDVHGDDAAVNVNFWITPDEANLDRAAGGLVVHPVEAPRDWRFAEINRDQGQIRRFLGERKVDPVNIPYRQNRAVIFNSDLFHATARSRFKPGYENRRINVTMLFGDRHG